MAIQSIPLANSLYLAMLSQERQDSERRSLKQREDLMRRDKNMRDTQDYILRTQDQKQKHEREKQEMALKQRAQLMQERIEQAGLMERRQQQDQAAMKRSLVSEYGRGQDRAQRQAQHNEMMKHRGLVESGRSSDRAQKRTQKESLDAQKIALSNSYRTVDATNKRLAAANKKLKTLMDNRRTPTVEKVAAQLAIEKAEKANLDAMRNFKQLQANYNLEHNPGLVNTGGIPSPRAVSNPQPTPTNFSDDPDGQDVFDELSSQVSRRPISG